MLEGDVHSIGHWRAYDDSKLHLARSSRSGSGSLPSPAGCLDPTLMNAAAWAKLEAAARTLETHSQHMAQAHTLQVGAHNDNLEGFATRAEIQVMIDANPNGFRALSRQMAEHAGELVQAAIARDHRAAGALAESLSEQCSGCHTRYWEKPE